MNRYQPAQLRKLHERKTQVHKKEMKEIKFFGVGLAMGKQATKLVIAIVVLGLLTSNVFL